MARQISPEPPKTEKPVKDADTSDPRAPSKPETKPIITDYASL